MKSTRGKLAIVAVGGIIALAGVLSGCSGTMNSAQTVSCERLNIVDKKGNTVVTLGAAQNGDGGEIVVFDKAGVRVIRLLVGDVGGSVAAISKDESSSAELFIHEHGGGRVIATNKGFTSLSWLGHDEHGAVVEIC